MTVVDSNVLDISNHDQATFAPECFYLSGIRRVVIAGERSTGRSQVIACQKAGLEVIGLYAYLYWGQDPWGSTPLRRTQSCINLALEFDIPTVWLDCEDPGGSGVPQRRNELRACVAAVEAAGLRVGIYTGGWWWDPYMGNTTEFSRLPLWHAQYGVDGAPRSPITSVNYGGWTSLAMHQYTSTKVVCGRGRDHNYLYEEGVDMTPEQVRAEVRAEWAKIEDEFRKEVGTSLIRFAKASTKRFDAISKATDLAVVPGEE